MNKIILATTSPYRKEAFAMLGIDFIAEGSDIDEKFDGRPENPEELVLMLAKLKAEAVAKKHNEGIVVGFDSIGWFVDTVLEKPKSREEAFERLKKLSGNTYQFYTGINLINILSKNTLTKMVRTDITMRSISDSEINRYLDQDPNYKTYAQGYDPLGTYGSTFISSINGSYNNPLRGIPLEVIVEMLKEAGVKL